MRCRTDTKGKRPAATRPRDRTVTALEFRSKEAKAL